MLRQPRRIIPLFITAFWLVMVGLFVYREGWFRPTPTPPAATRPFQPQNQWMGIFLEGGEQVGRLHLSSEREERDGLPGYQFDLDVTIETSLFGMSAGMRIDGAAWTSEDGQLARFDFSLTSGDHTMRADGTVAGKRLQGTLHTGGQSVPIDFRVENGLFSGSGIGLPGSGLPPLQPGESATIDAFDPMAMKMGEATVACLGEEQITIDGAPVLTTVYSTTIGGLSSKAWIGAEEELLQATTPFGVTLRKIGAEDAGLQHAEGGNGSGDLIQSTAIVPDGRQPFENARRLVVRVSGVALDAFPDDPPWQIRAGDTLTITQAAPPTDDVAPPDFDPSPFLASDAFVTSDHPAIRSQAREIVGEERDPWQQALLLHDWLFEEIEKVPVLSVPSALDVLRARTGDCNEHTVLYTALARALGIPTRIAIGLVYSDTIGGFGYHAWPEVYYGGWRPLDPTLGQTAADATHIKLLNGGIEAWVRLAAYIGQIRMEVVSIE